MTKIAPSILAADFSNLRKEIRYVDKAGCDYIHCDIMDGHFVPNISFGPDIVSKIRSNTKKIIDVHLMIEPVSKYINNFIKAGADIITFHIEVKEEHEKIIKQIKKHNVKAGIAIKPNTSIDTIMNIIDKVDLILIMTVNPGFGGQKFIESQLSVIEKIKKLINKKTLKIDIEVDGGINNISGKNCVKAGADILVAGSYIFNELSNKYKERIDSLR